MWTRGDHTLSCDFRGAKNNERYAAIYGKKYAALTQPYTSYVLSEISVMLMPLCGHYFYLQSGSQIFRHDCQCWCPRSERQNSKPVKNIDMALLPVISSIFQVRLVSGPLQVINQ